LSLSVAFLDPACSEDGGIGIAKAAVSSITRFVLSL